MRRPPRRVDCSPRDRTRTRGLSWAARRAHVGGKVGSTVGGDVGEAVGGAVGGAIGSLVDPEGTAIGADIGSAVGNEVGSYVGKQVGEDVGSDVGSDLGGDVGGSLQLGLLVELRRLLIWWPLIESFLAVPPRKDFVRRALRRQEGMGARGGVYSHEPYRPLPDKHVQFVFEVFVSPHSQVSARARTID